jgi:hypothetical protein
MTKQLRGLLREQSSEGDDAHILDDPVASVEELLSQIAETDVVVATRFHNVVFALLCQKPVIAISFHHKCESLMNAMGLGEYCLDINTLKADVLIEKFRDLKTNADRLKPLIRQKTSEFRELLEEQYKLIFDDLSLTYRAEIRGHFCRRRNPGYPAGDGRHIAGTARVRHRLRQGGVGVGPGPITSAPVGNPDLASPRAARISANLLAIDQRHVAQIVTAKPNAIGSQRMYPQPPYVYRVQ